MRARAVIGIADQAASALSNVLLMIAVARVEDVEAFGAFAISMMLYSSTLTVSRALLAEPYMVISNTKDQRVTRAVCVRLFVVAVMIGGVVGVAGYLALLLLGVPLSSNTVIVLSCLSALLVQDLARWLAIAAGRQSWALVGDILWVLVMAAWLGMQDVSWRLSIEPALVWVAGAVAGSVVLIALVFTRSPAFACGSEAVSLGKVLRLGRPAAGENLIGALGIQLGFYLALIVIGAEVVGASRGALLLLGPLGILTAGLLQYLLPHMSRWPGGVRRIVPRAQWGVVGVVTLVAMPLFLLPDQLGQALLGDTWTNTQAALPAMLVYTGFVLCFQVAQAGVRARRASSHLFRLRRVDIVLIPLTLVVGASIGSTAFFWAVTLTGAFDLLMVTSTLRRVSTRGDEPVSDDGSPNLEDGVGRRSTSETVRRPR